MRDNSTHQTASGNPRITIESEKAGMAAELQSACGDAIQVTYAPDVHLEGDTDAAGHLFIGRLFQDPENCQLVLDDRQEAPLEVQAIRELRRISKAADKAAAEFRGRMTFEEQDVWFPAGWSA